MGVMEEKVTLEGRMEALGSESPGYGSHRLAAIADREDNSGYVLTSDTFSLDDVEGQNVRATGIPVEGYPRSEGEPGLLNVTEVTQVEIERGGKGRPDLENPAD